MADRPGRKIEMLHRALLELCLGMIFFRKPVPTFRDHAA
jgi:hypothetical protein